MFSDALNAKPVEEVEIASGNANYASSKTNYELFGKWLLSVAGWGGSNRRLSNRNT